MTYRMTGDRVERSRTTHDKPYVWHAVECVRGREIAAQRLLEADDGVARVFFPHMLCSSTYHGRTRKWVRAQVPGFIFVCFRNWPRIHILKNRVLILGLLCIGERPVAFHPDSVRRLRGLKSRAELLREAERQARLIRAGDMAKFKIGVVSTIPLAVTRVEGEMVKFEWPNGLPGETTQDQLQKVLAE